MIWKQMVLRSGFSYPGWNSEHGTSGGAKGGNARLHTKGLIYACIKIGSSKTLTLFDPLPVIGGHYAIVKRDLPL